MNFTPLDLAIFVSFFVAVVGLSLWKSRRAKDHAENSSDFFLAGRKLTWPLIGISIVAANISTEQMVGMAGQAAGNVGLAVSLWQLVGSVGIVLIAMTLLPRFLRAGIYTMPEFLEYRYNPASRAIMAVLTVIIYVGVLLTAVLYSGGVTLRATAGLNLVQAVWLVGLIGAVYATFGGLKAIAWADLIQGLALLGGGLLVFFLGLKAVGGWETFARHNANKLHMVLPANHPDLPWTGVMSGMWIVIVYYCGLNQFIVQRTLAARTLRDGQLGMIFAGGLWLIVPFAIVMPGIVAQSLYKSDLAAAADAGNAAVLAKYEALKGATTTRDFTVFRPDNEWRVRFPERTAEIEQFNKATETAAIAAGRTLRSEHLVGTKTDAAFPTLIRRLIPEGIRGFILAAIAGAVISSLASMLNSAATIATMDVYQRLLHRSASQMQLVWLGRALTVVFIVGGCLLAPQLDDPRFGGVFQFIQQFQGYIWPGVVAVFLFGILVETAPGAAGVVGLLAGPAIYHLFQTCAKEIHFLVQVTLTFSLVLAAMSLITFFAPAKPKALPERAGLNLKPEPVVHWCGWGVIVAVMILVFVFR